MKDDRIPPTFPSPDYERDEAMRELGRRPDHEAGNRILLVLAFAVAALVALAVYAGLG